MARHTSPSHVTLCFTLLLSAGLTQASAQAPPDDLSGAWGSNIGLTYTITQSGSQITWTDSSGVRGTIVATPNGLSTTWSDAGGQHSATGTIVERDGAGSPAKIAWSNGVVFQRAATFGVQIAKPAYVIAPAAPTVQAVPVPPGAPKPQLVPAVQGAQLPGTTLFASTAGGHALLFWLDGINTEWPDQRLPLRSASMHLDFGAQTAVQDDVPAISISKDVDAASPRLVDWAAQARISSKARITVAVSSGGTLRDIMTWTLTNVRILSYAAKVPTEIGSPGVEELVLLFDKLTYDFSPTGPAGTVTGLVTGTYVRPGSPQN
jgi:type VI protein secretion system component Hcp